MKLTSDILNNINENYSSDIGSIRSEIDILKNNNRKLRDDFEEKYGTVEVTDEIRSIYSDMSKTIDINDSKIKELNSKIKELNDKVVSSKSEKYYNDNVNMFVPEIKEMIKSDIERDISNYKRFVVEYNDQINDFKSKDNYIYSDEYKNYKNSLSGNYYYKLMNNCRNNISLINDIITKDIISHYKLLQSKVESKVGKILNLKSLGGLNYEVTGENDKCTLEVIVAGGYNIQRVHTRWIIKK